MQESMQAKWPGTKQEKTRKVGKKGSKRLRKKYAEKVRRN